MTEIVGDGEAADYGEVVRHLEAALARAEPPLFVCEKCGYIGRIGPRHVGCSYDALGSDREHPALLSALLAVVRRHRPGGSRTPGIPNSQFCACCTLDDWPCADFLDAAKAAESLRGWSR